MKKGDRVMLAIFAALFTAALVIYAYGRIVPAPAGRIATVSVNGQIVDTLYLDEIKEPFRRVYETPAGFNTVYADSSGAAIVEADCHDQYCVRAGRIEKAGGSSVCLPHRFVLRVSGEDGDELDGGTY